MDNTNKKTFIAVQDNKILGCFLSRELAEARVRSEIENDKLKHILKRSVAKKSLKEKQKYLLLRIGILFLSC